MSGIAANTDTAFGWFLKRSLDGGVTYTDCGQVTDLGFPEATADTYDQTHTRSPDEFKEFGKALKEMGEATVTIQISSMDQLDGFYTDLKSNDPVHYGFTDTETDAATPNGPLAPFLALCVGVSPDLSMADRMTVAVTLQPTGKGGWV